MQVRFLSTFTVASALLLSTLGCSKKEESTPAPAPISGTGTYKLNGRMVNCKATAVLRGTGTGQNYLFVRLTTMPIPASGEEHLELTFTKGPNRPTAEYQPEEATLTYTNAPSQTLNFYTYNSASTGPTTNRVTIADSNKGGYSGSFAVTSYQLNHVITEGIFTDVRL